MNTYYLYVLYHSGTTQQYGEFIIRAHSVSSGSSGYYEFRDANRRTLACYPIVNTVIAKIEYAENAQTPLDK